MAKILAPVCPFFAEKLWQDLGGQDSVHLQIFPLENASWIDKTGNEKVALEREIVRLAASIRARKKIKLRQPLSQLQFSLANEDASKLDYEIIAAEANVKEVVFLSHTNGIAEQVVKVDARKVGPRLGKKVQELIKAGKEGNFEMIDGGRVQIVDEILEADEYEMGFVCEEGREAEATNRTVVILDTEITEDLELEGSARELIRAIQDMRKSKGFEVSDRISVTYSTDSEKLEKTFEQFGTYIAGEVLAENIAEGSDGDVIEIDGASAKLGLQKV
jgi:isoleucyl-tRNA synthetase